MNEVLPTPLPSDINMMKGCFSSMYVLYVTVDMIKLINNSEFFYRKSGILLHHLVNGIQQCWKSSATPDNLLVTADSF